MRHLIFALSLLLCPVISAHAQISVNIGINMPAYPNLVLVPDYPVYYDPQVNSNYFFYDGLYWVYQGDNWYSSDWYNGPWEQVGPEDVPLFVLRVPVRYYRQPPAYFRGWVADAPPRWGDHWGRDWETRRAGWDSWDHHSAPSAAPLPVYQRQYSGARYPRAAEQQQSIRSANYHYQPHEAITQQRFQQQASPASPRAEPQKQVPVQQRSSTQQQNLRPNPQAPQPQPAQSVQTQPAQPAPKMQRPQITPQETAQQTKAAPQDKGRGNKAAQQDNGQQNKAAPPERVQQNKAAPPEKVQQNKAAPPERVQQNKVAPPERVQQNKAAPPERVQQNKAAPPEKVQQNKVAPPERVQQNKAAPPEKGEQNKGAPQDKG